MELLDEFKRCCFLTRRRGPRVGGKLLGPEVVGSNPVRGEIYLTTFKIPPRCANTGIESRGQPSRLMNHTCKNLYVYQNRCETDEF